MEAQGGWWQASWTDAQLDADTWGGNSYGVMVILCSLSEVGLAQVVRTLYSPNAEFMRRWGTPQRKVVSLIECVAVGVKSYFGEKLSK